MNESSAKSEQRYLLISTCGNVVIGCVGVVFSFIASSQAILLDGLFNLTYFVAGLFTLKVARLINQGDDQDFPLGYAYFEPLINGLKGVLVLGVTAMALVGAVEALLAGGRTIAAGPAIGYGVFASVACWILAFVIRRGARRTGSPLIAADAENWLVNGAISSAVLLAFVGIALIEGTALESFAPYVDPALVLLVALVSISVPVRMAWQALMELLNRAPRRETVDRVREIVNTCTSDLPVQRLFVRVIQPGRTRIVVAHVVLPEDFRVDGLAELDAVQAKTLNRLIEEHPETSVDLVFTADPSRGAPAAERSEK